MDLNSEYASGTFANPDVKEDTIECIVHYLRNNGKSHPYDVISHVRNERSISRARVVEGIRKLRMSNKIVPAEPFVGDVKVIES